MAGAIFGSLDGIAVQCFMFDAIVSIIGFMLLAVGVLVVLAVEVSGRNLQL
jgi:hypothetical protein